MPICGKCKTEHDYLKRLTFYNMYKSNGKMKISSIDHYFDLCIKCYSEETKPKGCDINAEQTINPDNDSNDNNSCD